MTVFGTSFLTSANVRRYTVEIILINFKKLNLYEYIYIYMIFLFININNFYFISIVINFNYYYYNNIFIVFEFRSFLLTIFFLSGMLTSLISVYVTGW